MESAMIFWRLSMIACARACLNTGMVMMNAELIFLTRVRLEYSMVLSMGTVWIATFSATFRSITLWSRISRICVRLERSMRIVPLSGSASHFAV